MKGLRDQLRAMVTLSINKVMISVYNAYSTSVVGISATMPKVCPLCGPKLSAFCMVMSVWGVVFLGLLGVFFYIEAVSLFPDLHFPEESDVVPPLTNQMIGDKYGEKATQCWVAAGMYLVTLIVVFWQNKFNSSSVF